MCTSDRSPGLPAPSAARAPVPPADCCLARDDMAAGARGTAWPRQQAPASRHAQVASPGGTAPSPLSDLVRGCGRRCAPASPCMHAAVSLAADAPAREHPAQGRGPMLRRVRLPAAPRASARLVSSGEHLARSLAVGQQLQGAERRRPGAVSRAARIWAAGPPSALSDLPLACNAQFVAFARSAQCRSAGLGRGLQGQTSITFSVHLLLLHLTPGAHCPRQRSAHESCKPGTASWSWRTPLLRCG